jgi:DNA-binding response OmpR family regulator
MLGKILIVDDGIVSRRILEKVLLGWDYELTVCETGNQAWDEFQKGDYWIIISDWMMAGIDGLELCRLIRAAEKDHYVYIILLTARAGRSNLLMGMEAGADDYLIKPFDPDELKMRLKVAERILTLQSDVRTLRGILPICAWCKRIREDEQLWRSVEEYISTHTPADFSHSICPDCAKTMSMNIPSTGDLRLPGSGMGGKKK